MEEQVAAVMVVMVNKSAELRKERINLTKSKSNGEQKQRINTARVVCNNFLFLFCFFCICVSVHLCGCFLWLSGQVGFLSASLLACFHGRLRTCESWRGMGSLFSRDKVVKLRGGGGGGWGFAQLTLSFFGIDYGGRVPQTVLDGVTVIP